MSLPEEHSGLVVELLADSETDDHELVERAFELRAELLDLDIAIVEPSAVRPVPADAKGAGLLGIGALIVRFTLRPDVLRSVVSSIRSWVSRQRVCSVKLTLDGDSLEITGPHSAAQDRAIDLWIARHANSG